MTAPVLPQLVSLQDVTDRIPRTVDTSETTRINAIIDDVSAVVRSYCRRNFDQAQITQKLQPTGDKVKLPQRPVLSVDSIFVAYNNDLLPMANWVWGGGDEVWFISGEVVINLSADLMDLFAYHTPKVQVTYSYGYAHVPDDVRMVVCSMVVRALYTPSAGAMVSESVGPYSYRLARAGPTGLYALMDDERAVLNKYRSNASAVELRS